jgi:hypothetical protein
MKNQTVPINAMNRGPFLTLILDSTPEIKFANKNPSKVCDGIRTYSAIVLGREEPTAETRAVHVRPKTLGPFVRSILRLIEQKAAERMRVAAQHSRPEQASCRRIHVG